MRTDHISNTKDKAKASLKVDVVMADIKGKTPDEIRDYLSNKPMSVPQMREFIETFLLYIQANDQ